MADSRFRILTVCTGNICRSPAAELLLAAEFTDLAVADRFSVASAGTHALTGWPISPPMDELLADRGIPSDRFVARQATASMLAESDLILTATRAHRTWVAATEPRVLRRAFTLTEFADAVRNRGGADIDPAALVAWASANRPKSERAAVAPVRRGYSTGDILDPYGRGDAAYLSSLNQIVPLAETIAVVLSQTV
ncbi:MAG TPA: hypothetical protein VGN33_02540 [Leifsonia sp.]|nr:hypothetical protein [Leifsonia sp.]